MSIRLLVFIFITIKMFGCSTESREEEDSGLTWTRSGIGYYEDDSLNQARGYVIPRIVVKVEDVNLSGSKKLTVLSKDTTLRGNFFITFVAGNQPDTVFLNTYLNPRELDITKQKEGIDLVFEVNSTNTIDNLGSLSRKQLMEKIVNEGTLYYVTDTTSSQVEVIPKSKEFSVTYRNPNNTAVE